MKNLLLYSNLGQLQSFRSFYQHSTMSKSFQLLESFVQFKYFLFVDRIVADYLVYDFLYDQIKSFIVYPSDDFLKTLYGSNKAQERWLACMLKFYDYMGPALDFLYLQKYRDDSLRDSMESFAHETIEFAIKKVKAENRWEDKVLQDIIQRLRSIKFYVGYPDEFTDPHVIEEMYRGVKFDAHQSYAEILDEIYKNFFQILREPATSKTRKFTEFKILKRPMKRFRYLPEEDIMCNF